MRELFSNSQKYAQRTQKSISDKNLIIIWWLFWVSDSILNRFIYVLGKRASEVSDYLQITYLAIGDSILSIISGILVIQLIVIYNKREVQFKMEEDLNFLVSSHLIEED